LCYDFWGNSKSRWTNKTNNYAASFFSNVYYLYGTVLADASTAVCLPDAQVYGYVSQDSVSLMWRYADCEACGSDRGQTVMRGPIYGSYGALIDEVD